MARLGQPRHRLRPSFDAGSARLGPPTTHTAAVLAAALTLNLPLTAIPSSAAGAPQSAAIAGWVVLPAAPRAVFRATQILSAGTSGFLWAGGCPGGGGSRSGLPGAEQGGDAG